MKFTLRVTGYDGLYDLTSPTVVVLPPVTLMSEADATSFAAVTTSSAQPIVTFFPTQTNYDPAKNIVIGCTIVSGQSIRAKWHSDDVELEEVSDTRLVRSVGTGVDFLFQLSIAEQLLSQGRQYVFQLLISPSATGDDFALNSQIEITVNDAPSGGWLSIAPSLMGYALNTSFFLNAIAWDDEPSDYPIKYLLTSYSESPSVATVLKTSTEIPYVTTFLGQGLFSMQYVVTCVAAVSDIYGTTAMSITTVQVYPILSNDIVSLAGLYLSQALSLYDSDSVNVIAISAAEVINAANCSNAPDCESLNRYPCHTVPHTCGRCMSGEYVGSPGESNDQCFEPTDVKRFADSCSDDWMCLTGKCIDGRCGYKGKTCAANCSLHGECEYFYHDGTPYPKSLAGNNTSSTWSCTTGDFYCYAQCTCHEDYYGADCSLDRANFLEAKQLQELMCASLLESIAPSRCHLCRRDICSRQNSVEYIKRCLDSDKYSAFILHRSSC